ncbi:MAG: adenylate/guanylate cyclase domain-containing protein [Actinobacteria bacterium]|nr:adenylate/guanylate cyclase domain-containing protein [Actinomycetota bacterium]
MAVPKVEYAKDGDLHVAYQVWGDGPIDLVLVWGLFSHCELFWEDPPMARFLEALGRFARVIQFDKRGTGMSDAVPGVPTLEQRMDDLRIVMDAVGSERAAIFGESEGGPMSCLFAATFPERVSHLILFGPLLRLIGDDTFQFAFSPAVFEQWLEAMVDTWGTGVMMAVAAPSRQDQAAAMELSGRFERIALNRGAFRDLMLANARMDIRPVLPTISVPTLVLHRVNDGLVNIEQGRYAANQIPGAHLVELPGVDHYVAAGDVDALLGEVRSFLTGGAPEADLDIDRVLSTVLFTDIVASTETAARLGDRKWRALLDDHDRVVDTEVRRSRGRLIKTTGDGALATFDGPARAVRCAKSIAESVRSLGIEIRAGVHTGEVELRGDDVGGIGVHIGARVASAAQASQVLVSRTVVDLVAGSGLDFSDVGVHELKGVPGEWQLFASV